MWRAKVAFLIVATGFTLAIFRLFYWQVIRGDALRLQAAAQYNLTFNLPASRGSILSSDGNPFVLSVPAYLIVGRPSQVENLDQFSMLLSDSLGASPSAIYSQMSQEGRFWVPLKRKADKALVEQIEALKVKGLDFERESKRFYPEASNAAHILGFVGSDQNGADKGYFGLEGFYDRELRGKDGRIEIEKDVRGAPILVGEAKRIAAEDGRSLVLHMDRTIQHIVEKKLLEGIAKYGAKEGSAVMMDPKTGAVLAMASYPSYDPANYTQFDRILYKNPIVGATYEPGSTFKVLVMAAALNEKKITAQTTVDEDGPVKVGEYSIRTWNNEYHGKQTMMDVIQHSSNVGMVFVERQMGKDLFIRYIRDFGFGALTGIDLEDETSPELRPDDDWREIDLATASFGQGIAVTPLQMVRAVSAIANGGWLMEPHVVSEIKDKRGKTVEIKPKRVRKVIDKEAAEVMTEIMINAVDNGEAKWAKPKGYRIAGKTGTAQIPVSGHYDEKKTIASFVGFAPADDPRFVMLITLREPTSSPWGSETAAPLFFAIARDALLYMGIAPKP